MSMKRNFSYIFLTCSLLLVLGHSILPHDHVDREYKACEITSAKTLSLSEIIKLALAHDIGANHLEEFNNCQPIEGISKNPEEVLCLHHQDPAKLVSYVNCEKPYLVRERAVRPKYLYRNRSLRAPPSLS